jgi:hypothetical protein
VEHLVEESYGKLQEYQYLSQCNLECSKVW